MPEEISIIEARYPHEDTAAIAADLGVSVRKVYEQAAYHGVKKSAEYLSRLRAEAARRIWELGINTRLRKGLVPWNKGKNHPARGRSAETQFKSGSRPHNWQPIGSERLSKDGILQRKMTDTNYQHRDWVPVHRLVWLAAGRALPDGFVVVFKDGNNRNFDLDNLEAVSRKELMARNSVHRNDPEIARLYLLVGAINRQIHRQQRKDAK